MSLSLSSLDSLYERLAARAAMPVQLSPVEEIFRHTLPERIPGYEVREPQIEMARLIENALQNNEHVLAEAGTGTGKSLGYLIPIHLYVEANGGRAIVSTGTIALQEQLINKDIPLLESVLHTNFRARLAKGKGNYLCRVRLAAEIDQVAGMFGDPEQAQLLALEEWAAESETGDRAELSWEPGELWSRICADDNCPGKKCIVYSDCFVTRAKERLRDAQIIVCNHALFMLDLALKEATDHDAKILPEYQIACLDEAHKVEEIARAALSTQCSINRLPMLLKQAQRITGIDFNLIEDAKLQNDQFFMMCAALDKSDKFRLRINNAIANQGVKLLHLVEQIIDSPDNNLISDHETKILENLDRFVSDLNFILSVQNQDQNVYWVEKQQGHQRLKVILHATPIDVAPMLADMLFGNMDSVIMTSATLSAGGRFDYLKQSVGCNEAREIHVESPFDYPNQCLLYLPENLPDPISTTFHAELIHVIYDILRVTNGRALVLFTSYKGMNEVYSALADKLPWRVLRQNDLPKRVLIETFRQDTHSVLFGTQGLFEGISIDGESLSCVIIDRLPFAVPDEPISQAKADFLKRQGINVFRHMSLPEAILKLKQAFGRLIRTRTDRGVVAILDNRITTKPYGKLFLRSLPAARPVRSLAEVERFFEEAVK